MSEIVYLCDRKQCGSKCNYPKCKHTTDILHAINFEKKVSGVYVEKENTDE